MNLKEFYKTIEDIALHLGPLDELNKQQQINKSGRFYELMPFKDNYLIGLVIPKQSELKEMITAMVSAGTNSDIPKDDFAVNDILERIINPIYELPKVMNTDIRLKAKKFGARGLIHVQFHSEPRVHFKNYSQFTSMNLTTYSGIPVKLIGEII